MSTLFRRTIKTLASVLPLVESIFDIARKARDLMFGEPAADCGHGDDEFEDVASEDAIDGWGIEISGERVRAGDRLVLRRRRAS